VENNHPAGRSKIHPEPNFRFAPEQMEAQKPHPTFLEYNDIEADNSYDAPPSAFVPSNTDNTPVVFLAAEQQQQQMEEMSEYEKQLHEFERQISSRGNIDHL